jgi:hypothetical protein
MALFGRRRDNLPVRYKRSSPDLVSARHNAVRAEMDTLRSEMPNSLTAAGELVQHGDATYLRRLIQAWQVRAMGYYDIVGPLKYAAQFYSRALAQLELFAGEIDEKTGEVVRTTNPVVIDALARIKDPGGTGRTGLLANYGRLIFLVGEAYLLVTINPRTKREQWEMLSTDEVRLLDGLYTRFKAPQLPANQFHPAPDGDFEPLDPENAVAYRIWKRHPRWSQLADSSVMACLDILEEYVLLTQAVRARARSRLAGSGVLFIDDRITTTPSEATPDEDPQEDPFLADLTEAMTKPIINEGTAGAVVPLVARVRVPEGMKLSDLVYHLQIIDPTQVYPETGLRDECIRRLAVSLDMPPEVLLGISALNHWSAWSVDEITWKYHLQPVADSLVQDLTDAYLSPYLIEQNVTDWDKYVIAYDATAVINHPDRTKDAKDLFALGALSEEALRDVAAFGDNDAPTEEERWRYLGVKLRDPSLTIYGVPSLRQNSELEPDEGTLVTPSPTGGVSGESGGASSADVEKTPPPQKDEPTNSEVVASAQRAQAAMVQGAAQLALLRAREAAGSRLRTLARRDDEAQALIDGVGARDVAAVLGKARVRKMPNVPSDADLVNGAHDLIVDALRVFGITDAGIVAVIAETVERHAARTLYELKPAPLPDTFPQYVNGLLAAGK